MKAALPLLALAVLAACAPAAKAPSKPVASAPAPRPRLAPPAPAPGISAQIHDSWMDVPLTPGNWSYEDRGNLTLAVFSGQAGFAMHCWRPSGLIRLLLGGEAAADATIRTETAARTLPLQHSGFELPSSTAMIDARDPLLDAMALSKGRFAIEVEGQAPLILPSHAEVSRVIEDCR